MSLPRRYTYRYFGTYRFMLACLVMLQHFGASVAPQVLTDRLRLFEPGSLAVLAFFALSGFVIAEAADVAYPNRPRAFFTNRLLRVFPHFWIAILLSILLQTALFHSDLLLLERELPLPEAAVFTASGIPNLLLNFLSILPGVDRLTIHNFIPIAWAVRIEMAFYVVVALALYGQCRAGEKSQGYWLACAGILLTPLFLLAVMDKAPPMFGFLPYFSFGVALYYTNRPGNAAWLWLIFSLVAIAWHFLSLPLVHPTLGFTRDTVAQGRLLAGLLALLMLLSRARFHRGRMLDAWLGELTYPLYLYHYIVMVAFASLLPNPSYLFAALGMVASIAVAYGMTRLVDPIVNKWRNRVRGERLPLQLMEKS